MMRFSSVALLLFGLSVLLPQGVGLRLPAGLPNLDLPRMAMVALLGLFALRTLTRGRIMLNGAPRTLGLIVALAVWQVVSALASESSRASLIWAVGNAVTYWGFAFAVLSLTGGRAQPERVVRALTVVGAVLVGWSILELLTQSKLVAVRNVWADAEVLRFSTTLRRVIPGGDLGLPLVSIGPYASNLSLAGALCAMGGFLVVRGRKSVITHRVAVAAFVVAVLATQSRAGIIAAALMILLHATWRPGRGGVITLGVTALIVTVGWVAIGDVWKQSLTEVFQSSFAGESAGSVGGRVQGLAVLLSQINRWWLVGFGPGSLFDADRVVTSLQVYSDPGSLFAFFVESGLPTGLLLTWLVAASILDGLRSRDQDVYAATLGLIGFVATALVSLPPWAWGIALVDAGLVESWVRTRQRAPAVRESGRAQVHPLTPEPSV